MRKIRIAFFSILLAIQCMTSGCGVYIAYKMSEDPEWLAKKFGVQRAPMQNPAQNAPEQK